MYLDDILIYIDNDGDSHITAVQWVLGQLRKYLLYVNLKKCQFHQEEIWFLGYVVCSKGIHIEDERIEVVKQWPEPQLVRDIQVFLKFDNFYWWFFHGFSRIAASLISMLKTSESTESLTRPGKGKVGVGGDIRAGCDGSELDGRELDGSELDGSEVDGVEVGDNQVSKKVQNLSKSKKTVWSDFLTLRAKLAFAELRQAFIKAPILHHFDPECYIGIETDASGYAIGGVLSQLTSDDLGRWHPFAFFSQKIIPAESRYETHNSELLAIVEAFKT